MSRKTVWLAAALLLVPGVLQAQQVTATAEVEQHAVVSGTGDLAFGPLSRSADNVINAAGGSGAALRSLEFNHNVRVTFGNVPSVLTAGSNSLAVSLMCAAQQGATWSAPAACSSAELDLDVGAALTTATLGFGGTIAAANVVNAVAGSYSGTFDIVVTAR